MPNPNIGKIMCPSCDNLADVREDKKQNAYIVCGCGYQAFTRDKKSNENIRRKMKPEDGQLPATPPAGGEQPPAKKNHGTLLG